MSKVRGYQNTARYCFIYIRFDCRERILISVANHPVQSVKVIKLLAGIIPYKTLWEFNLPDGEKDGNGKLVSLFLRQSAEKIDHPLYAITTILLTFRSCY